jgi:protein YibB
MNDITIVTAFFDLGRGNLPSVVRGRVLPQHQHRTVDTYFNYFENLAKIQNDLVVYTTPNFENKIFDIRRKYGLENRTRVVVLDSYLPKEFEETKQKIRNIMDSPEYYNRVINPELIEYWHDDYVLVNIFKSIFVSDAIEKGIVNTDLAAWIDFGYCRNDYTIPPSNKWSYDFDREKIHMLNQYVIDPTRPIDSIIYTGDVYVQGCHIVAGIKKWSKLKELMIRSLNSLIENNLIDDDQTLLLMSYLFEPSEFELHATDPTDWFVIFKKFNEHV